MDEIKNIIEDVLRHARVQFSGLEFGEIAGQKVFKVKSDDPKILIGTRGETIRALDYIVKRIAEQRGVEDLYFLIDVNDYRSKQIEDIQNKAKMMAERAKSFQYDVELTPMSAYERLIVHTTLSEIPNVKTESHGEGRNRRVVIRYSS
jgi:spoIIIJ-associated protein